MNPKQTLKKALSLLTSLAMLLAGVLQMPSAVLAREMATGKLAVTEIDDTDSAWTYDSNWHAGSETSAKEISEHWTRGIGATATLTFTGTRLEIYGVQAPSHNNFTVSIDGGEEVEASCYAADRTDGNALLYSSETAGITLENTEHTATIVTNSNTHEGATAEGMSLTYALSYTPEYVELVSTELDDSTDAWTFGSSWKAESQTSSKDASEHWTRDLNEASATLTFTGTVVEIFGYQAPLHSNFSVTIDGVEAGEANCYAEDRSDGNALLYSSETAGIKLENKEHTVTVQTNSNCHEGVTDPAGCSITYALAWAPKTEEPGPVDDSMVMDDADSQYWRFAEGDGKNSGWAAGGSGDKAVTEHWSQVAGTSAELRFSGNELEIYGFKDPKHRCISVQIDDGDPIEVDCYAASRSDGNALLFSSKDAGLELDDTKHTAIITTLDKANESAGTPLGVSITYAISKGTPAQNEALSAFVGDAKLLDRPTDYASLAGWGSSSWSGTAWKGDALNSKVIVASGDQALEEVTVTATDFKAADDTVLSKDNIRISWLENMSVREGRNNPSASLLRQFPDRISGSRQAAALDASSLKFAWLTIQVPADQKAGTYTGTITVCAKDQSAQVLNYTLEVVDLTLPEDTGYELQLWQHPYSVANYYLGLGSNVSVGGICNETSDDFYFSEDHFKLMKASMQDYAAAGGHDVVANIVPEAWNHQSFYGDPTMVDWTKNADGTWSFDYTDYDKWIEFQIECGVIRPAEGLGKIKCYSIVPWNNQLSYYDAEAGRQVSKSLTPGGTEWTEVWSAFLTDFLKHSDEKGWTDITYIALDERDMSMVEPSARLIKSIQNEDGKTLKASSALNYPSPDNYDVTDLIDDISINQGNANNRTQIKAFTSHRQDLGLTTTIYTCTGDFPGSFTSSDPGDNYWSVLNSVALGANGFMKWAYDNYVSNMYGDSSYRYWEPGDGWFIYPENRANWTQGQEAGFYSTPRYEMLKQGLRDARKISWLQNTRRLSDEQKEKLDEALNAMSRPASTTVNGAATYASAAARAQVHSQTKAVSDAINELSLLAAAEEPEGNDRTELKKAIAAAQAVTADDYTAASIQRMNEALAQAQAVDSDSAAQADIDEKTAALKEAISDLIARVTVTFKNGDTVIKTEKLDPGADASAPDAPVRENYRFTGWDKEFTNVQADLIVSALFVEQNFTALDKAIEEAGKVDSALYTPESVQAVEDAKEAARTVRNTADASQSAINDATKALNDALAALEPLSSLDYTQLSEAIRYARSVESDKTEFQDSGKSAFEAALKSASDLMNKADTQKQINNAASALNQALLAVRRTPSADALK